MVRYIAGFLMLLVLPAKADVYAPILYETEFRTLINGKELRYGMFGISLVISADGKITGKAMGSGVTGTWAWREGYFCREMDWSGTAIESNCQLVEARGDQELRFTVDRGEGRSARFKLR